MKEKTHDLNHDLTFSANTINCVCHSIRSMFRLLGIYNFAFRLDFNMFDITDVATTGVCTDSFTVTGPTGRNPSVICGVNTGQHSKSTYQGG